MPYSNIVFVKLFIAIIDEDDRFLYQLNESQQLLYLKMLILAGKTGNSIPKTFNFIKNTINYNHEQSCFESDIKRLMEVFPKLKQSDNSYYFVKFEELHNYIPKEIVKSARKSQGNPKDCQRIAPDKEVEVEKEEDKEKDFKDFSSSSVQNFFTAKNNEKKVNALVSNCLQGKEMPK